MRIGLFSDTYSPDINGVVSSIVTLQRALIGLGHDVFVVTNQPKLKRSGIKDNILRLPGIEIKQLYGYTLSGPFHRKAIEEVRSMKLDVIHVHTEFGVGIFARRVAKKLNIPVVSTYHTTYEDYTHYLNIFKLKSVERFLRKMTARLSKVFGHAGQSMIAPSQKTKDMLLGYGINRPIYVVPTGLDLERFDKIRTSFDKQQELRTSYKIKPHEFVILFVGRIAQEKSIDLVIEGYSHIDFTKYPCVMMIVGGGPDEHTLQKLAKTLHIEERVIFVGKKPAVEVPQYYHSANAFVSASLTETQGMTFIEALAGECPVFARPDEVLNDLVIEDETGYFFTSMQEFADKVMHHIDKTKDEQLAMTFKAKKQVECYDSRLFGQKVADIYSNTIFTYKHSFLLQSVKTKQGVVECLFMGQEEPFKVIVSQDSFVAKGLRTLTMVDDKTMEELLEDEKVVKVYQSCIRKLAFKDRTRKEMYDYLTQKTDLNIKAINTLIEHLEARHYIDDLAYTNSAVTTLRSLLQGKFKITKSLRQKGISQDMIDEVLQKDDQEVEMANALKYAEKIKSSIKETSLIAKKDQLSIKLFQQGYERMVIDTVMASLSFVDDEKIEVENCRKAALKALKKYSPKYQKTALRNHVFNYLSNQGYPIDTIYIALNEMEWKDD